MAYSRNRMFFALSTLTMFAMAAYISVRLLSGIDIPTWLRVAIVLCIFVASQSISAMRILVTMTTGVSFRWMRLGGFVSALFMMLGSVVIVRDITLVLFLFLEKILQSPFWQSAFAWLNSPQLDGIMLVASIVFAALGMWSALRLPHIHELEIRMPTLPKGLDGIRIGHLSDLHIGSTFDAVWLQGVVERTNAMQPDIILITGDLVDGRPAVLADDMRPLEHLQAKLGVVISVGNHEYYSGVMPWVRTWRAHGLTVLLNEHRVYDFNGTSFVVAGIADASAARFPGLVMPDAVAAKAGAPDVFSILMAHQPENARQHAKLGYQLQLSGHTHGGQYFFLFPLVKWLNKGFRSGLYTVNDMKLYVSPGTGLWGYVPMRIGSPSEITILTLRYTER